MNGQPLILHGSIMPDGTLELDGKLALPPGRVQVTIAPISAENANPSAWEELNVIIEERKSLAVPGRTKQEIDSSIRTMREEWDESDMEFDEARHGKI